MERCAKCGAKRRDGSLFSPLGEAVCAGCYATIVGAVVAAGTGSTAAGIAVGSTRDGRPNGILGWVRRAFGKSE